MDNDQIRIDLLKFRRKAYNSYAEGSEERKNFLKILLKNELQLSQQEIPKSLVNFIVEGKNTMFWEAYKKSIPWIISMIGGDILFGILFVHHHKIISFLFLLIGSVSMAIISQYFYEFFLYCQDTKEAKKYLNTMNNHIIKISNDIKKLEGPR